MSLRARLSSLGRAFLGWLRRSGSRKRPLAPSSYPSSNRRKERLFPLF
jgi:hypothetical protein